MVTGGADLARWNGTGGARPHWHQYRLGTRCVSFSFVVPSRLPFSSLFPVSPSWRNALRPGSC